ISFITPPVALGAYAAASVAQSNPMKTGLEAMRLGSIIYFVPFFFVLNPALIGQGTTLEVLSVLLTSFIGITLIAAGLQGYLFFTGALVGRALLNIPARVLLVIGGLVMVLPGNEIIGYTHLQLTLFSALLLAVGVALAYAGRRRVPVPAQA
ncbi:MAG: TRAP transporter large permease subunit, partial [Gammaproteobacteria bacterium]|nr:TRAP transporter large permease subunit [Gammaproteobacteria bacterium]